MPQQAGGTPLCHEGPGLVEEPFSLNVDAVLLVPHAAGAVGSVVLWYEIVGMVGNGAQRNHDEETCRFNRGRCGFNRNVHGKLHQRVHYAVLNPQWS